MPEGHTIHRLARDHAADLVGKRIIVSSPQGRFSDGAAVVSGRLLKSVEAHGKHLFYVFGGPRVVHVHLGLFGKFRRWLAPAPVPRPTVRMRLEADGVTVDLVGPTACELLDSEARRVLLARLGPDPLRDDDPAPAFAKLRARRGPIGAALLDQSLLAGVGNVYRAEALFVNGIHPLTPASQLSRRELGRLWKTIGEMLRVGVEEKRIVTVDAVRGRRRIRRRDAVYVYRRDSCNRCAGPVSRLICGGRATYACARCQVLRSTLT